MPSQNAYQRIVAKLFVDRYKAGMTRVPFDRADLERTAKAIRVAVPKNLGDILYTVRYRGGMPLEVVRTAPAGLHWIIRGAGKSKYYFALEHGSEVIPNPHLAVVKILDATPAMVARYCLDDEQALLARLRYNRLIDVFTSVTCYSLQSHLRTHVASLGQVETDEIYVGMDKRGAHFVFPVQAKGGSDRLGVVQVEQDFALCRKRFPELICRPVSAQFLSLDTIALFEFIETADGVRIANERHYRLVSSDQLTSDELAQYRLGSPD